MSDLFGKQLRKQTARAKERLLEGLGKAKATQDDVFDYHASNLSRQSKSCERFNRDLKAYALAMKTMVQAQKTLRETVRELYEPDWPDREHLCAITQSLDLQWDELEKTVNEQLIGSVSAYTAQFIDLKTKVSKRGRKLVDFDSARNNYAALKGSTKRAEDDPKVLKATVDLQQADTMYRELNRELLDVLPAVYDSRITFFVDSLQTLFNAETNNYSECVKFNKSLVAFLDNLGNAFDTLRVPRCLEDDQSLKNVDCGVTNQDDAIIAERPKSDASTSLPGRTSSERASNISLPSTKDGTPEPEANERRVYPSLNTSIDKVEKNPDKSLEAGDAVGKGSKASLNPFDEDNNEDETVIKKDSTEVAGAEKHSSNGATADVDESHDDDNRKILYKVRATHRYAAEDTDELSFDAGEVISVLEANENDLLDDGWLLGFKQSNGSRGVFPANFTKPV